MIQSFVPAEGLLALTLAWLALLVTSAGIELSIGTLRLASKKVIVPGMAAWLLALACGALSRALARRARAAEAIEGAGPAAGRAFPVARRRRALRRPRAAEKCAPEALHFPLAWLGSTALFVAAVWRGIGRPFMLDDNAMVAGAEAFAPGSLAGMLTGFGWSTPGFVRPLPELLWVLDVRLHGASPLWCHAENLALHALNALLVGLIARSLFGDALRACLATALFAVCATHAEPLLWLSCRYDLLAATFALGALAALFAALDAPALAARSGRPALALSVACTLAALLSKESALSLPVALAALAAAHPVPRPWRERARAVAPHLIALAAFVLYRALFVHGLDRGSWAALRFDKIAQLPLSPLAPLGWPINVEQTADLHVLARAVIGLVLALPPLLAMRQIAAGPDRRILIAFALLALVTVPVHHVLSLAHDLRQSRYLYLPAALFAVLVAGLTRSLAPRRALLAGALLVAVHAALLRSNAEPFAAAGAIVTRALAQSAPVVSALEAGETVLLRGLPLRWRGADTCLGSTVIVPMTRRAGVPADRLHLDGDAWRPLPDRFDRVLHWSADRGFQELTVRAGAGTRTPP